MVAVPGGTQQIFSLDYDEFSSTVTAFSLGKYEVTYELWHAVRTWATNNGYVIVNAGREGSNGTIGAVPTTAKFHPVSSVNWRDALVWCNAYSELAGKTPVYCSDAAIPIKSSNPGGLTLACWT